MLLQHVLFDCQNSDTVFNGSISGLVVEYIVAIDVTRVRFPADAICAYRSSRPHRGRRETSPLPATAPRITHATQRAGHVSTQRPRAASCLILVKWRLVGAQTTALRPQGSCTRRANECRARTQPIHSTVDGLPGPVGALRGSQQVRHG